jgi:hypothetical protein
MWSGSALACSPPIEGDVFQYTNNGQGSGPLMEVHKIVGCEKVRLCPIVGPWPCRWIKFNSDEDGPKVGKWTTLRGTEQSDQ